MIAIPGETRLLILKQMLKGKVLLNCLR